MSTKKLQLIGSMNADTLDGMHASEFATVEDIKDFATETFVTNKIAEAQLNSSEDIDLSGYVTKDEFNTKVGDTSVAEQISSAVDGIDFPVDSVNGKTGAVKLTASDVGALPSTTVIPSIAGLATETYVNNAVSTKVDKVNGKGLSTNDYTTTEKTKLSGIAEGANKTVVDSALSSTSTNPVENKAINTAIVNLSTLVGDTKVSTQISDAIKNKSDVGHTHTIANISGLQTALDGKEASGAASSALSSAKSYTDTKISDLINSAPTTLDTLGEIATAMKANDDVVAALDEAVGKKANASDLTTHTGNKSNPHGVTLSQLGVNATATELNYVDGVTSNIQTQINTLSGLIGDDSVSEQIESAIANKSDSGHTHNYAGSSSAGGAATSANKLNTNAGSATQPVYFANGVPVETTYTLGKSVPSDAIFTDTTYGAAGTSLGLVKSGGDVTISSGVITVNDDSHAHIISNVDGLQSALDGKANTSHEHSDLSGAISNLNTLVGDTKVSTQIEDAIANKSDSGHTHDDRYYTETEINTKLSGKSDTSHNHDTAYAAKSHGTHVTFTTDAPKVAGTAAVGTATTVSRSDHVHPAQTNITGNAATATKATQDASGNIITSTYATKTELNQVSGLIGGEAVSTQISNAIKNKADATHTHSAYVNQNAFSNVVVGSTTIAADSTTDTLTMVAGNNITLTPDASGDKITIAATDTVYTHPNSGVTAGTYKSVTVNAQGHVTSGSNPTTLSGYGITDAATKTELGAVATLVGDTKVSDQISTAIANKSDSGHTHDGRYYTESEIDTKLSGKANTSHGNHVPATETANNAKFLRNDNTWQTVTPANIGAAATSHGTHVSYSTTAPVMDGTASVGSAATVARSDHKHPTDTSRAAASDLSAVQQLVGDTAVSTQISNAITPINTRVTALENNACVEITSAEIKALFA